MGNRIQGFLAGVFVTGSIAAATVGTIKGDEQRISGLMANCDDMIKRRILGDKENTGTQNPLNKRSSGLLRPSISETCKDIWNEEIIKMVNRVYAIDWYLCGLTIDRKVNTLANKAIEMSIDKK